MFCPMLLLFSLLLPGVSTAGDAKPQAKIGELLIVADGILYTHEELANRGNPRPGYHYVRISGTISNVGKHALCGLLSAKLETTYNLESLGTVTLAGSPIPGIHQLLPGEHLPAEFDFDVKDGVDPLRLVIKQNEKGQGCSRKEPLPLTSREASFTVANIPTVAE